MPVKFISIKFNSFHLFYLFLHKLCLFLICLFISIEQFQIQARTRLTAPAFKHDETIPRFQNFFQQKGIGEVYSHESVLQLQTLIQYLIEECERNLAVPDSQQPISKGKLKRKKEFLNYAANLLINETASQYNYILVKNIIYMLYAKDFVEEEDSKAASVHSNLSKKAKKLVLRILEKKKILHVSIPRSFDQPVGVHKAQEEAEFLVDPTQNNHNMNAQDLAHLTPLQIAELDVPNNHPMWYQESYRQNNPSQWQENEKMLNEKLSQTLTEQENQTITYNLQEAKNVLFFDEIKESGTSPKIDTKDAFNQEWTLKWSPEIHTSVVVNRLYTLLGGKFVDPVYSVRPGVKHFVLITPMSPEEFLLQIKKSKYKADIKAYVHSSGQITKDNMNEILQNLSPLALKKYQKEKLVNKYYITFKEGVVTFRPKAVVTRGGPISWSQFSSENDRVKRGLLLFNSWINNLDPKEDNSRGFLISNNLFISQNDMGNSLTGINGAGNVNEFDTKDFIFRDDGKIRFDYFLIYLPGAWKQSTYSDLLWMGKKIVRLNQTQIEQIVSETYWPDFMQKALVYKLLKRRNEISKVLQLTHELPQNELDEQNKHHITPPCHEVFLGTLESRKEAALKYEIPFEKLEESYLYRPRSRNYSDVVLEQGQIDECTEGILIRLMHIYRNPTGLDRRRLSKDFLKRIPIPIRPCGGIKKLDLGFIF